MRKITIYHLPVEGKTDVIEIEDSLDRIYELIECDSIDMIGIGDNLCLVIDDDGRFTDKKVNPHLYPFIKRKYGMGIVGDYFVTRIDENGRNVSLTGLDISIIEDILKKEEQDMDSIMLSIDFENDILKENPQILAPKIL